jgi:hypothetical protein
VGADNGDRGVILVSRDGVEWSDSLTPLFAPILTYQPQSFEFLPGEGVSLYAQAVGNPVPTYQWRFNGNDIPGATQSGFEITNAMASHAGNYTIVVRNEIGAVTSLVATLTVPMRAPEFIGQPQDFEAVIGGDFSLLAYADAAPAATYQWFFNNMPLPGQTDEGLNVGNATTNHAGSYYATASNVLGVATSQVARVKVLPLRIYSEPQSQFMYSGSLLRMEVGVTSVPIPAFQWFFNGASLPGANLALLEQGPVTTNQAGTYFVVVSNIYGVVTSHVASSVWIGCRLHHAAPAGPGRAGEGGASFRSVRWDRPISSCNGGKRLHSAGLGWVILQLPRSTMPACDVIVRNAFERSQRRGDTDRHVGATAICLGGSCTVGGGPCSFRLCGRRAEPRISGVGMASPSRARLDTLVLKVSLADAGDYDVVASNWRIGDQPGGARHGLFGSAVFRQPSSGADSRGQLRNALVYAGCAGSALPMVFQRCSGPEPISVSWPRSTTNQSGLYTVVASNAAGVAISRAVTVTVRFQTPVFLQQPFSQTVLWGQPVSLSVYAEGGPQPAYQWLLNEAPIPGATLPSLYFPYATPGQSGSYRAVASNSVGMVTSAVAVVTVNAQAPIFTTQPSSRNVLWGGLVSFFGTASGGPPPAYQWLFNGTPIAGATNNSLQLNFVSPAHAGNYRLIAFNSIGSVTSVVATLTVLQQAPIFSQHPVSRTILWGGSLNFSSLASGGPPPTYQWLFNDVPIPGATSRTLPLSSVTPSQAGNYRVVASNPVGVTTSLVAVLTVNAQPPSSPRIPRAERRCGESTSTT